ncbi:hypothetical protein RI367_006102 [Sorochytrium milnesiophthora]
MPDQQPVAYDWRAEEAGGNDTVHFFDIDDNVLFVPSNVVLFRPQLQDAKYHSGAHGRQDEFEATTAAFAQLKSADRCKERSLPGYDIAYPKSFRLQMERPDNTNPFLDALKRAMAQSDLWRGPMWADFQALCVTQDSARRVFIVTSRLSSPESLLDAFQHLVNAGHLKHAPPLDNIWTVAHPDFRERFEQAFPNDQLPEPEHKEEKDKYKNWSAYKSAVTKSIIAQCGAPRKAPFSLRFSDDDPDNVDSLQDAVREALRALPAHASAWAAMYRPGAFVPGCAFLITADKDKPAQVCKFMAQCSLPPLPPRSALSDQTLRVNTSNWLKLAELQRYLGSTHCRLAVDDTDLPEPDADPVTIIRYKASTLGRDVLCDDSTLEVLDMGDAGTSPSGSIKFKLDHLDQYIGHRALFVCMLGIRRRAASSDDDADSDQDAVHIYRGEISGRIVSPWHHGKRNLGFLPWFAPEGMSTTLAESVERGADYDHVNPRRFAVSELLHCHPFMTCSVLEAWRGKYQE